MRLFHKCIMYRELCIPHISLKRMGFSSVPRLSGWSFQQRICGGVLPLFPLSAGFPPLISCEKRAPFHQSLQKSPYSFTGWQKWSGFAKLSYIECCQWCSVDFVTFFLNLHYLSTTVICGKANMSYRKLTCNYIRALRSV